MPQAGALEPRAGERQHVERQVEAEAALDVGAEQFQHAAGAGAEIEQRAEWPVGERGADRGFDRVVGDMQLADAVPLRRHGGRNRLAPPRRGQRAPRRAARGRARSRGRRGRGARPGRGPARRRRRARRGGRRPRRLRGNAPTRPASASSRRCREMRGCDWRRISVRSETVSSASASSARMRSRVASPAALRAAFSCSKGRSASFVIRGPRRCADLARGRHIKISLCA